ncbi:MAG: hypothetical protein K6B42_08230 [Clostridia bacterium]|nr:hypothetical protein [Clostridia bacterium]
MTNEELVLKIQKGEKECMPQLWDQVKMYITWSAERYLRGYPKHYEQLKTDCVQAGYFAVVKAVDGYSDKYGPFTSYLKWPLRNEFREVIYSGRGQKKESDPLNDALSLDMTIITTDGEETTIGEYICDKEAGEQTCYTISKDQARFEDSDQWQTVRAFLERGLKRTESTGEKLLLYMLENDCTYREAVTALYGDDAIYSDALRGQKRAAQERLKRYVTSNPKEAKKLNIDHITANITTSHGLRQYGLESFKHRGELGYTSAVEMIALGLN